MYYYKINIFLIIILFQVIIGVYPAYAIGKADSKAPVAINADNLEILQDKRMAIFTGAVEAQQGNMRLFSHKMTVYYLENNEKTGSSSSPMGGLDRIEVDGNVRLHTGQESATAEKGIYDAKREKLFLFGNVLLRRGENVLNGSRLEYNLVSGTSMLSGGVSGSEPKSSGRVRAVFTPSDSKE